MKQFRDTVKCLLVISITSLVACEKSIINEPTSQAAMIAASANLQSKATTVKSITSIPASGTSFPVPIDCVNGGLGEVLLLQGGNLMVKSFVVVNDNHYTSTFQFQPMGITAIGATTGDLYHAAGGEEFHETGSFVNEQSRNQIVDKFYWIGQGGDAAKFKFNIRFNLVTNAEGKVTASIDEIYSTCQ